MNKVQGKRTLSRSDNRIEWLTLGLMAACYCVWLVCGLVWQTAFGWLALPVMAVMAAFHTSLQHETIHGHPTRWGWLNEALVSVPLAVVFPYRRYRDLHLKHHDDASLTDPYEDPESYFWPENSVARMPGWMRVVFMANNTFVGRLIIGPWLTLIGFGRTEIMRAVRNEAGVRSAWAVHLPGLAVLAFFVVWVFAMPFWVYALAVVYPALSLTAMRAYAEHQAAENVGARSAVVETSPALALLYLNNNLHIVHHANPSEPWHRLPKLYRERRHVFLAANENTLFDGYMDIAKRFAFRVKQPVDHPFLHRSSGANTMPETAVHHAPND
ncbi:MAG: fatty acid desaturase [Pseudomonadota bacterium]